MAKRVVVIASGATERLAIPHLTAHLRGQGIEVSRLMIPPNNSALNVRMAAKLIRAAWFGSFPKPDKFVVLVDTDGKTPSEALGLLESNLPSPAARRFARRSSVRIRPMAS